jgi:hypothetical protein
MRSRQLLVWSIATAMPNIRAILNHAIVINLSFNFWVNQVIFDFFPFPVPTQGYLLSCICDVPVSGISCWWRIVIIEISIPKSCDRVAAPLEHRRTCPYIFSTQYPLCQALFTTNRSHNTTRRNNRRYNS